MMGTKSLHVPAYAKINLSLEVLGRRDDGYHNIATIMQTVDLADDVIISPSDQLDVRCDDPQLMGPQNIVWDAAVALATHSGVDPRARIVINKRIPTAAGLGGGSADAAAALRGLNMLWDLGLPRRELYFLASGLGSDVPFLLDGGIALATERGDFLEPMAAADGVEVLLVVPPESIPRKTPTLYGALTPCDYSDGIPTQNLARSDGLSAGTVTSSCYRNTFTRAALGIFPGLRDVWHKTAAITRHPPCLSGAGPALFCMPSDQHEKDQVTEVLRETGALVFLTRTINPVRNV